MKNPICKCGTEMSIFDGVAWYTCPFCGNAIRKNSDGTFSLQSELFGKSKGDIDSEDWQKFEEGWRP